jgi:WhiB family redox-sensing transcriptional regulator
MVSSCPTVLAEAHAQGQAEVILTAVELGLQVDPISRNCPDDLPCQVADAELWFAETPDELEQAKLFCQACPVRLACLSGTLERREPWGVWGGEIFDRGAIVARKRPRGRPRKADREAAA